MSIQTESKQGFIGLNEQKLLTEEGGKNLALIAKKERSRWYNYNPHDVTGIALLIVTGLAIAGYFGITGFDKNPKANQSTQSVVEADAQFNSTECIDIGKNVRVKLVNDRDTGITHQELCLSPYDRFNENYLATK